MCIHNGPATLSLEECQALTDKLSKHYGGLRVDVRDGRGRSSAAYDWGRIRLPRWARSTEVVLHEMAHHLTPPKYACHGPEFVWVYIELLTRELGLKKRDLNRSARDSGLKIRKPEYYGGSWL